MAAVLCGFLCGTGFAQELDVNGYSKVVVPRSQGDYFNYQAGLREAARDAGFELNRSVEEIPSEDWPKTLYLRAGLNLKTIGIYVVVYDVALQTPIAVCQWRLVADRRVSPARNFDKRIAAILRALIDDMGYRGFDQSAYEANVRARNSVASANQQS
ncbi:MAG TPA: hypothetical protein VM692_07355, partial [Gammaproteobacteria bacterium]|nr:hypothetical protein [Gammaproteobacteria bacterium]